MCLQNIHTKRLLEEQPHENNVSKKAKKYETRLLTCKIGDNKHINKTEILFPKYIPTEKNNYAGKELLQKYEQENIEIWVPVVTRTGNDEFDEYVYKNYEISNFCRKRSFLSKREDTLNNERITLGKNKFFRYRVSLQSFFPDEYPKEKLQVDHVDQSHINNTLSNLEWVSPRTNTLRSFSSGKERKSLIEKKGKKCKIIDIRNDGKIEYLNKVFDSITTAAIELNFDRSHLSDCCRLGYWCNDYKLEYVYDNIDGEIFKDFYGYSVSNKGRVKNLKGVMTIGNVNMSSIAYGGNVRSRFIKIKIPNTLLWKKKYNNATHANVPIHILVWVVFKNNCNPPEENMVVMHDDTLSDKELYREDGTYFNYVEHLSLGTQQENIQSMKLRANNFKKIFCIESGKTFQTAREAGAFYKIKTIGNIHKACRGERQLCGGFRWKYVD